MSDKNMHITVDTLDKADVAWLPERGTETGYEWKYKVDLSGSTTMHEVDALLRALIGYNNRIGCNKPRLDAEAGKDALLEQLYHRMDRRELILRGGIHFEGDGEHIYTGCCCGLETWVDICRKLENHSSPWMGHDPDVSFLEDDGICYIADVNLVSSPVRRQRRAMEQVWIKDALKDESVSIISWQPEEFHSLLDRLYKDFDEFLEGPLQKRMEQLTDGWARQFVRAFARCFRKHRSPHGRTVELKL